MPSPWRCPKCNEAAVVITLTLPIELRPSLAHPLVLREDAVEIHAQCESCEAALDADEGMLQQQYQVAEWLDRACKATGLPRAAAT